MRQYFLAILLSLSILSNAQFTSPEFVAMNVLPYRSASSMGEGMFLVESEGKTGVVDRTGKMIFSTQFDKQSSAQKAYYPRYVGGKVVMYKNRKAGLIDNKGNVIVPFQYDDARLEGDYSTGLVTFKNFAGSAYGFVDFTGKQIVPNMFQSIQELPGFLIVKGGNMFGMMNKKGEWILQPEYSTCFVDNSGKMLVLYKADECQLFDATGKLLFKSDTNTLKMYSPSEGMISAKKGDKYGYLNTKGAWVVPAQFDYVGRFQPNGVAIVGNRKAGALHQGLIDKTGKILAPLIHKKMGYAFGSNLIEVGDTATSLMGYMDSKGKWVIKATFMNAYGFDKFGGAWVQKLDKKWVYIDVTGKELGGRTDGAQQYFGPDGFAIVQKPAGNIQIIDKTGKTIKETPFVKSFSKISEERILYQSKDNNLIGYMDLNGDTICGPIYGPGSQDFSDGMAMVQGTYWRKYGFINQQGKLVIPIAYDTISSFVDGWAIFKKNGQYGLIDKTGKEATLPRTYKWMGDQGSGVIVGKTFGIGIPGWRTYYIDATTLKEFLTVDYSVTYGFQGEYAAIQKDFGTTFYFLSRKGVLSEKIDSIDFLSTGLEGIYPTRKRFGNYGYINVKGKWVTPPNYRSALTFSNGFGRVQDLKTSKWGLVDKTGQEVVPAKYDELNVGEGGLIGYKDTFIWGVLDKTGKVLLYPQFNLLSNFSKDRAIAMPGVTYMIAKSPLLK